MTELLSITSLFLNFDNRAQGQQKTREASEAFVSIFKCLIICRNLEGSPDFEFLYMETVFFPECSNLDYIC